MAARKSVVRLSESWRERISSGALVDRLQKHAQGQIEMTSTQIKAAEILLRKCIPDLAAIQHSGEVSHRNVRELSLDELTHIAAGGSAGATEADSGEAGASSLH